jgi:hypothetical protein
LPYHTSNLNHNLASTQPCFHRYRKSKNEKALAALRPPVADEMFEITETIEVFVREEVETLEQKIV